MKLHVALFAAGVVVGASVPRDARAAAPAPSPPTLVASPDSQADTQRKAEAAFNRGVEFMNRQQYAAAREALLEADRLAASAQVLWDLAYCEMKLDLPVDSLRHLRSFLRDPDADPATVAKADDAIGRAVAAKVVQVRVKAPAGAVIRVDNEPPAGVAPLAETIVVSATGQHTVTATIGEKVLWGYLNCNAGSTVALELPAPWPWPWPPADAAKWRKPHASRSSVKAWTAGTLGVATVGLVASGVGMWLASKSAQDKWTGQQGAFAAMGAGDSACYHVTSQACADLANYYNAWKRDADISYALYGAAGATALAGLAVLVFLPGARAASAPAASVGPHSAELLWTATF